MNSWKFNSTASGILLVGIASELKIPTKDVYKTVKSLSVSPPIIETKDGKKYKLKLEEVI